MQCLWSGGARQRRLRNRSLEGHLFREPAWHILLDLYVAEAKGKRISISSACSAASISTAAGLGWLAKLEGGADRTDAAGGDGRSVYVRLTEQPCQKMTSLLFQYS